LFLAGIFPPGAAGQLRRASAVQPVAEIRAGDALIAAGSRYETNGRYPVGGLTGDLFTPVRLDLAYAIGDRAVFEVRGSVWQILSIDTAEGSPLVALDSGVEDGVTADAGDFELSFSFLPLGSATGFSAGGHIAVKLPNTDERKGIGPNTTDVTIAALFSWGAARWRATGWVGIGILEAPVKLFEQNDVVSYAVEWLWQADGRLRIGLGARGRVSTRRTVPIGTEDLGEVRLSGEWRLGAVGLDLGLGRGFTGNSADWQLDAGLAWTLARGR